MGIYIRSQDRTSLSQLNSFEIVYDRYKNYYIRGYNNDDNPENLGFYRTLAKSLDVLDEIMNSLRFCNSADKTIIYEMPKEVECVQ